MLPDPSLTANAVSTLPPTMVLGVFERRNYRVPNFILAFIPAQINRNTLNTMTAFAVRLSLSMHIYHRGPQLGYPSRHIKPARCADFALS